MSTRTPKASTTTRRPAVASKPAPKPAAKSTVKSVKTSKSVAVVSTKSAPAAKPAAKKPAKPTVKDPAAKTAEAKVAPKPAVTKPSAPKPTPVSLAEVEAAAALAEMSAPPAVAVVTDTAAAIASLLPTPPRWSADDADRGYRSSLGTVSLAASGPGDVDLVSVRTASLLGNADVVLTDLSAMAVAERFAGRRSQIVVAEESSDAAARVKQAVQLARSGSDVVRLMGDDPSTDSAWANEASLLQKAKVPFEISPAVSLISGVTSHAGIPLISGRTREVRIVDADDSTVQWSQHIDNRISLVVLNGADRAVDIARDLVAAGRRDDTPVAITRDGTTVEQRTITSTLGELATVVKATRQVGPGVMVIGETVGRRSTLSWFETKPLFGWRILVPRTKESQPGLIDQLRRFGAVAVEVPTISVEPPRTPQQMERAVHGLVSGRYQWIIFTSVNAVRALREKFAEYGLDSRAYSGLRIAAVGYDTAEALEQFGVRPDLMPSGEQSTAALVDEFPEFDDILDPINRVFLPRADIATEGLVAGLTELGWEVDDVTAYRTVRAAPPAAEIREAIKGGGFDAVLFTSSSTVRNLVGIAGKPHQLTVVACIGPQSAKAAQEHGLRVDVLSQTSHVFALVEALAEHGEKLRLAALDAGELTWRPSRRRGGMRRRSN